MDRFQRSHSWAGFPLAVIYKFFDDRAPHLAAMVTYYAFVALFPLMLLFTSAAGFVLQGNAQLKHQLIQSALKEIPGLGPQLADNIRGFHGSAAGVAIGLIGTLYGSLGAMQAAQAAFNHIYGVPRHDQPDPFASRVRSLGLLLLLGLAVIVSTGVAALVATGNGLSSQLGVGIRIAGYILSFILNVAMFAGAVQLLTARELHFRNVLTGGVFAGAIWELLQVFGSRYVAHEATHGRSFYGVFGVVLATIAWIYLQSLALMIAAEMNVVLQRRLWPRALLALFSDRIDPTPADQKVYSMYAAAQRFKGFEVIDTRFRSGDGTEPADPPARQRR